MNWLCEQLFYRKHLSSSVKRRKAPWSPDTQQYAHLNSAVPCDSAGRCVCHWDLTQVIRILFKYVFTESIHTSFIFTSTGDYRPPALFCLSRRTSYSLTCFILFTVRCVLLLFVSLPNQSSCPDENVMP